MGVINVTPDSFSDGGRFFDPEVAVAAGIGLLGSAAPAWQAARAEIVASLRYV